MQKMIWRHNGTEEPVLFISAYFKSEISGFLALVMTSNENYIQVPIDELKLETKDYNKVFAR